MSPDPSESTGAPAVLGTPVPTTTGSDAGTVVDAPAVDDAATEVDAAAAESTSTEAVADDDEHVIKVVYSCREEARARGDERYRTTAAAAVPGASAADP